MACDNQVGVRNIFLTFTDCDTGSRFGPFVHELSGDEQPQYKLCAFSNEPMTGGYVRRTRDNQMIELSVIRNLQIPLAFYQGCSAVDITVEHYNGMVITGLDGTGTGDETSDGHEVSMTLVFRELDELLPSGTADAAPALAA